MPAARKRATKKAAASAPKQTPVPEEVDDPDSAELEDVPDDDQDVIMCQRGGDRPADWITTEPGVRPMAYCDARRPANHDELQKKRLRQ